MLYVQITCNYSDYCRNYEIFLPTDIKAEKLRALKGADMKRIPVHYRAHNLHCD